MKTFSQMITCLTVLLALAACGPGEPEPVADTSAGPYVVAATPVDAGRYLAIVSGCNDCHTPGWLETGGKVTEDDWFTGSSLGWRGPWGTTYANNLRLSVQHLTEDDWVDYMHLRTDSPPMPWMNVNQMSEKDARAIYQYIASLGPKGADVPAALPPGAEPATPFILLEPQTATPRPESETDEAADKGDG